MTKTLSARIAKGEDDFFDFKADSTLPKSFANDYLRQYYLPERELSSDETALYRFIRLIGTQLKSIPRALEVGCGPTVHHAVMLAPFVDSIDLADYLEENLAAVEHWRKGGPDVWDWSDYSIFCSAEDGLKPDESAVREREALTRKRIGALKHINLLSPKPLGNDSTQYDLVGAFYCTEEIALTVDGWRKVMRSVKSLIKPGGYLLMSCLADTDFYHIRAEDGSVRSLPCARITKSDLEQMLDDEDFAAAGRVVEELQTPDQKEEGVPAVFLALARRNG